MSREKVPMELRSFWQVSDLIPKERIQACTKNCPAKDCCLSVRYLGGTLMARSQDYDKDGNLSFQDPNRREDYVCCRKCWKEWFITQDENRELIVELLKR